VRPETVLSARGVSVRFPGAARDAVRDISFYLATGETLALFGPSGGGKSSLAMALLGVIPALVAGERGGEICVRGAPLDNGALATGRMRAASVLQDTDAQIVALTVEDEIAFALENRGLSPVAIDARIDAALAAPPAQGLSRRDRTLELSGGWRQRLALAAALADSPDLLVVDEPVAHLDEAAAAGAIEALGAIRMRGCASIIVEHRCDHVAPLADRALVLDRCGQPVMIGRVAEVMARAAEAPDHFGLRLPASVIAAAAVRRARLVSGSRETPDDTGAVLEALGLRRLEERARGAFAPMLTIEAADVRRGRRAVLHAVDLAIGAGEVVGVTGPNGAGKTTLAFLAAGAIRARGGAASHEGAAPIYLPQNPALAFATATLAAEAARRGLSWDEVAPVLDSLELPSDPARHPLSFSHGERRRLGLAFAIAAREPRLVILDEPVAGLDGFGLSLLRRQMERLRAKGCGVMLIAHDVDFLLGVCDRVAVLDGGRIVCDAPPREVAARILAGAVPLRAPDALKAAAAHGWSPDGASR